MTTGVSATTCPATVSFKPEIPERGTGRPSRQTTPADPVANLCRPNGRRQKESRDQADDERALNTLEDVRNPRSPRTSRSIPRSVRTPKKPNRPAITVVIACPAISRRMSLAARSRRFAVRHRRIQHAGDCIQQVAVTAANTKVAASFAWVMARRRDGQGPRIATSRASSARASHTMRRPAR